MPEAWYEGKFQGSCWMNCPEQNISFFLWPVSCLGKAQNFHAKWLPSVELETAAVGSRMKGMFWQQ